MNDGEGFYKYLLFFIRALHPPRAMSLVILDLGSLTPGNYSLLSLLAMQFYNYIKYVLYQPANSNLVCPDAMTGLSLSLFTPLTVSAKTHSQIDTQCLLLSGLA